MSSKNEFFSYGIQEGDGGFFVMMYDLFRNPHAVCFTKNKKVAQKISKDFDNLAIAEEQDIFEKEIKN